MIGVALAFLAPWIIALTAFIGIGARDPPFAPPSPAMMQRVCRGQ